jgi:hypothetical protein
MQTNTINKKLNTFLLRFKYLKVYNKMDDQTLTNILNKGTGAGGANTNLNGKLFEAKTSNEPRLLLQGFIKTYMDKKEQKNNFYLEKVFPDGKLVFVQQSGLKKYIKQHNNLDIFRCPDEAYIWFPLNDTPVLKILEKKEQQTAGSVDTKLLSGPAFKREYELALEGKFKIEYAYCLNEYFSKEFNSDSRKYKILGQILSENNIPTLFGDNEDYFGKLDAWIGL